jgi:hypothetical protein
MARSKLFKGQMFAPSSSHAFQASQITGILLMAAFGCCDAGNVPDAPGKTDQVNSGARIECVTPDGHSGQVSKLAASEPGTAALITEDGTVTCLLQEGKTDFVVELPKAPVLDRLTFLNENAVARGELKIAVSSKRLRPDSPAWIEVEGIVPFSHKRLFGVSLLGIDAKFVRLSFHVEKAGQIAPVTASANEEAMKDSLEALDEKPFDASALNEALNSDFAKLHGREGILLSANSASVAPLSAR